MKTCTRGTTSARVKSRLSKESSDQWSWTLTRTIDSVLVEKPGAAPKMYCYAIERGKHERQLKAGQTRRDVKTRVAEQTKTARIETPILVEEFADREDGSFFTAHQLRTRL